MTALAPDAEKLVYDYLSDQIAARVVSRTPSSTDEAWVRVTQIDAGDGGEADHLIPTMLQLDIYAAGDTSDDRAGVRLLRREVRAALKEMPAASFEDAVVSGVRIIGDIRVPDTDFENARERFVLTAQVWAHA